MDRQPPRFMKAVHASNSTGDEVFAVGRATIP
jgi:hypothetical protein